MKPAKLSQFIPLVLSIFTVQASYADDVSLLDAPLEELLQTPVITAQALTQQYNNAFSAVSVITAEDIRQYGYRTLKEILNGMRGLHTFDYFGTDSLNSRGYSSLFGTVRNFKFNSRLMLLIDGENIGDNQLGQVLLGADQLVDVNLIERVEYVPGAGSVRYADTAFLGTINIITKKGQAWAGTTVAAGFGRSGEQYQRLQYSGALPNEGEVLAAYSNLNISTQPLHFPAVFIGTAQPSTNNQLFLQMRWPEWQVTLAHGEADNLNRYVQAADIVEKTELKTGFDHTYLGIDYNVSLSSQLKSSTHLFLGQRKYLYSHPNTTRTSLDTQQFASTSSFTRAGEAMWWGFDQELVYRLNAQHTILAGMSWRDDFKADQTTVLTLYSGATQRLDGSNIQRARASVYLHDDWQWLPSVKLSFGTRFDHNNFGNSTWSPRASVQWQATDKTSLKLSHAVTYRDVSTYEVRANPEFLLRQEQLNLTEFVMQHQMSVQTQLLASVYRYHIDDYMDPAIQRIDVSGQELEYTQQWDNGVRTRMSLTHQASKDNMSSQRQYSPHMIGKFNLAIPFNLGEKRFYLGLDSRYVSAYQDQLNERYGDTVISNLTLNLPRMFGHIDSFVTVRNVFNGQDATGFASLENQRNVWVQMEYLFK